MFITLSRQFAAGGSEVAALVADTLGWTVIDNAFIDEIASRTGYSREDVESLEERVPTFMERLAQSSALSFPDVMLSTPQLTDEPEQRKLARLSRDLVAELGRRDRMVFVGRAAAAVLAGVEGRVLGVTVRWRPVGALAATGAEELNIVGDDLGGLPLLLVAVLPRAGL